MLLIFHANVFAFYCLGRHYYHTAEVKYQTFHELPGENVKSSDYIMKMFTANTSHKCMQACTQAQYCQSANFYQKVSTVEMICDFIERNKWKNISLLVKKDKFYTLLHYGKVLDFCILDDQYLKSI